MSEMIKGSPSFLLAAAKETHGTKPDGEFAVWDGDGGWLIGRSSHKERGFIFPSQNDASQLDSESLFRKKGKKTQHKSLQFVGCPLPRLTSLGFLKERTCGVQQQEVSNRKMWHCQPQHC